jgi:putative hydrolase of the HAD superfamily
MPIRAIGFDIDGTLYKASDLYLKLIGKGLGKLRFLAAFAAVRRELRQLILSPEYRARGIRGVEELHRFQAGMTASRLGRDPEQVYRDIETFFYGAAVDPFSSIPPYPGVIELLDELRADGYKLGALSDFPCDEKIRLLGLGGKFDVAMTSEETGLVKPDRASFDLLAQRMGVRNDEVLYVGNSEAYDVRGALGAGMRAALIARNASVETAAELTFFDFRDLGAYIRSLR